MLKPEYPFYLANRPQTPNTDLAVTDKYSGEVATRVPLASPEHIEQAITAADAVAAPTVAASGDHDCGSCYGCWLRLSVQSSTRMRAAPAVADGEGRRGGRDEQAERADDTRDNQDAGDARADQPAASAAGRAPLGDCRRREHFPVVFPVDAVRDFRHRAEDKPELRGSREL